ncbi:MAG: PDZ domain-containing protein [Pyrinomonadaceae bacterium]
MTTRYSRFQLAALAAVLTVFAFSSAPAQGNAARQPDISYNVSMSKPFTHLLEVEMRVRLASAAQAVDLVMPVWTPGSYLVREYERHVQDFVAADEGGRPLPWRKVNKNTWRIDAGRAREFAVHYRVYANEMTVRTNELNDRHAFWTNAALLMYVDGHLNAPATLRIVPPPAWKIATGLPAVAGQQNTFRADNFDILYDSPVEVGPFKTLTFDVQSVPHRIVIEGDGNYDAERMRNDIKKVVEAQAQMMGDIPYRDYTFILNLRPTGSGGLEHLNSTALIWPRFGFGTPADYRDFLGLASHEFFHLWNVKRIRPDALGPFDYTKENYTRLLWVAEGITSYYETIFLRRAGLISDREYLSLTSKAIQDAQNVPGRFVMSVEEASFDAWIKYYRPDENSVNSQVSYYDKGALLGLLLDLRIRKLSGGARSLDDVMRYLYTEFSKKGRNYTPEEFQRAAELAAGSSLEDFFRRYVRGREELDYNAALSGVGLMLDTTGATAPTPAVERSYLGARLKQDNDRLILDRVYSGTPAYDQGLNTNDQIVALDGLRVNQESFNARLAEKRPGDTITLTFFRIDDLRSLTIKLGGRLDAPYRIVPVKEPNAEQSRLYQGWLGTPLQR